MEPFISTEKNSTYFKIPLNKYKGNEDLVTFVWNQYKGSIGSFIDGILQDPDFIQKNLGSYVLKCGICFDEFDVEKIYTLDCPKSHKFCYGCLKIFIEDKLKQSLPPTCPQHDCKYLLSFLEVGHLTPSYSKKFEDLLLNVSLASSKDCVGCPQPGCKNWFVVNNPNIKERCECICQKCFCSLCKEDYHYNLNCDQVPVIRKKWIEWNLNGRNKLKETQIRFGVKVKEFEKKKEENEKRNYELKKKFENDLADEKYKENKCRICPNCKRVVESLGGCDIYICGRDYHGGNAQQGCGAKFHWSKAEIYKSNITSPEEVKFEEEPVKPPPELEEKQGEFFCDECKESIKGYRFSCINCPCWNYCWKCEENSTLKHNKNHIFRVIQKNEFVE